MKDLAIIILAFTTFFSTTILLVELSNEAKLKRIELCLRYEGTWKNDSCVITPEVPVNEEKK